MRTFRMSLALAVVTLSLIGLTAASAQAQGYGATPYRGLNGQPSIGMGAYVWPSATRYLGRYNYPSYYNTPYTNTAAIPYTYDPAFTPYVAQPWTNVQPYGAPAVASYNLGPAFQNYGTTTVTTAGPYLRYYGSSVNTSQTPVYNSTGGTYYGPGYFYP
jgi:hypothetical protein